MHFTRRVFVPALALCACFFFFSIPKSHAQSCVAVTTYHNDNSRTAQNLSETLLTPANVRTMTQLFVTSPPFDGWALAQPLYLPQTPITISGVTTYVNVVYVATIGNSVYAFDADSGLLYWYKNYGTPDLAPFQPTTGCSDSGFANSPSKGAGIVGTPVIDQSFSPPVMYFVTKEFTNATHSLTLHAIDTSTGNEFLPSSPLQASVVNHSGATINLSAPFQMSRPALLLSNGTIYVGLGSVGCKQHPNYGWVLSYTFNPTTGFTQQAVFNTTPDLANPTGALPFANGGIWQGGGGLAADATGNIYFETADANNFYKNTHGWQGSDFGDSIVMLTPSLGAPTSSASFFTPYNDRTLEAQDQDLASSGPILLPDQPGLTPHVLIGYGKGEEIFVINRDNMGGYSGPGGPNNILQDLPDPTTAKCSTGATHFTQCFNQGGTCGWGPPAYWNNYLYFSSHPGPLMSYAWTPGSSTPLAACPTVDPGFSSGSYLEAGSPSISANGTTNGVLWAVTSQNNTAASLRAYDATNLATPLFRASVGGVGGFVTPTIAAGTVYVATRAHLYAFGIKGSSGCIAAGKAPAHAAPQPNQPQENISTAKLK